MVDSLSPKEQDKLLSLAMTHYFIEERKGLPVMLDQEKSDKFGAWVNGWVPDVDHTILLLEGINEDSGRPIRVYVSPGRRLTMVETLN
jgi:hypothetical protein